MSYPIAKELGIRCRRFRKVKKMSMKHLAEMVNTTPQNISRIEKNGIYNVEMISSLSQALGVNLLTDDVNLQTVPIDWILSSVYQYYNIKADEQTQRAIHSIKHRKARRIAMYLLREYRKESLMSISQIIGASDITVVMFNVSRMEKLLQEDEQLKIEINEIIDIIVCRI